MKKHRQRQEKKYESRETIFQFAENVQSLRGRAAQLPSFMNPKQKPHSQTMKFTMLALAAALFLPGALTSCSTPAGNAIAGAAAGAVAYEAIDNHREKEKRDEYIRFKHAQKKKWEREHRR
jgi:hypothetical protein